MDNIYKLLASLIVLRHNLHLAHWNVVGDNFMEIHKLFEKQYNTILLLIDRLAEYIRTTDNPVNLSFSKCIEISIVPELSGKILQTGNSIKLMMSNFEIISVLVNFIYSENKGLDNILGDIEEFSSKQKWIYKSYQ